MTAPGTPRLSPAARVGRVALQVGDLEASLRFYRDGLGLHAVEHVAGLARLGTRTGRPLLELHERPGVRPVPRGGLIGLYHFAVLLPSRADLGRFVVHAANAGYRFGAADHLFSEALYLTDPDGLQVEVYRDRPHDEWQYRNGEIVADTLPLDVDAVVAAAGGSQWSGMPDGTTIGHVHHFVGDLDRARDFYVTALGFTPTVTSYPGALFVAAGDYHHHVGLNTWAAESRVAGDEDARLLWWELLVPGRTDVDAAVERLADGYPVVEQDGAMMADDPWRIRVRLGTAER